jgi:hypothetical protein
MPEPIVIAHLASEQGRRACSAPHTAMTVDFTAEAWTAHPPWTQRLGGPLPTLQRACSPCVGPTSIGKRRIARSEHFSSSPPRALGSGSDDARHGSDEPPCGAGPGCAACDHRRHAAGLHHGGVLGRYGGDRQSQVAPQAEHRGPAYAASCTDRRRSCGCLICLVGTDFAVGASESFPIGVYTSRGAQTFVSAPGLHPPVVRADVVRPGQSAKGYVFIANLYEPSNPAIMVGQSGPLIRVQRLSPVWFKAVPENDLAGNLSLQTYEGQAVLAWWQGQISDSGVVRSGQDVVVVRHYRVVARLHGADGWVLTLHEIVIHGDDAWVTASKNLAVNLSRYGGASDGSLGDSAVQEYNLKTGKLLRSWHAAAHIPLSDSEVPSPTDGSLGTPTT